MSGRKQFDVEEALDRAMLAFWKWGFAETSLDTVGSATRLGRGSLYGAFGDKDALFRLCLDRYAEIYGRRYLEAMGDHPEDPVAAVTAFFEVVLQRIADPTVPDGCLIAHSAMQSPTLSEASRALVQSLLQVQRARIRTALSTSGSDDERLDELASFVVAVNQSLAVLSRVGTSIDELRTIARFACASLADALDRPRAAESGRQR